MDTLRLESFQCLVRDSDTRFHIFINNKNFIDMVREIEQTFCEKEGDPHPEPGQYTGFLSYDLACYFNSYIMDGKMYLLSCDGCGDDGCWSIIVQITITGNTVTWSNFFNPHRGPADQPPYYWDFSALGPFVFDKDQYVAEFTRARKDLGGFIPKPQRHPYYSKL